MYKPKRKRNIRSALSSILLVIVGCTFLYPVVWMVLTSLKGKQEIFSNPFGLPAVWVFENYPNAIASFDFARFLLNSVLYTGGTILLTLFCAALFAYAVARMNWKLRKFFLLFVQIGLVIPVSVIILSLYVLLRDLGLKDTYSGLILVYAASALPISVLILHGYFRSLPFELEESAFLEGCGVIRAFFKIMLPMVAPAIVTVTIVIFMNYTWNEFTIAFMTIGKQDMRSLPIALTYFMSLRGTQWGMLGATMVLSGFPAILLYLTCSESIENAITTASVLK